MNLRELAKTTARGAAQIAVAPVVASFAVRSRILGRDLALQSTSQWMALIPGLTGQYLRRAFLSHALDACHSTVVIEFGTTLSRANTRLDAHVYIGVGCRLGLVHVERDVLIASGVHVPSGASTHGFDDTSQPIREQGRAEQLVRIGAGAWIGERAVVMADVGREAVVGAGAVVTRPVPAWAVSAGVPARVLRRRNISEAV
jgi:virginiamycin A acetyltransferase